MRKFNQHEFNTVLYNFMEKRMVMGSWSGPVVLHNDNSKYSYFAENLVPFTKKSVDELLKCAASPEILRKAIQYYYGACFCPTHQGMTLLEISNDSSCQICNPKAQDIIKRLYPLYPQLFPIDVKRN